MLFVFFYFIRTYFDFSGGLTKALGNTNENPNDPLGVDLAQIVLGVPPRPLLAGATPRPSGLGVDGSEGLLLLLLLVFCFCTIFILFEFC